MRLKARAGRISPIVMGNKIGSYAAGLMAALLVVACNDAKVCQDCNESSGGERCLTSPALAASAGDGEVTLTWKPSLGTAVKAWQIRRAIQGESWSATRSTGPAATAYVVSGLKNDMAYTFQVRAQLDAADFDCWSAPVSVVPRQIDDVMREIEKHQRAIAESMVDLVNGMEAGQTLLKELGEQGIATLGAVATSTSETARHTADTRDGVNEVASKVDLAGDKVVAATNMVAVGVDDARQEVVEKLNEIVAKLDDACDGCDALPANCHHLGNVFFEHDIHTIEDEHRASFNGVLRELQDLEAGFVLTEGHASSVGHAVHNLRLSDQRAACVSRCLDNRLNDPHRLGNVDRKFAFMEIARGEVLDVNDPAGTSVESEQHQRVAVAFCSDYPVPDHSAEQREPVWPDAETCGCTAT